MLSGAIGLGVALVFAGVGFARHSPAAAAFVALALVYALINGLAVRRYLRGELQPK